MNLNGDIIIIEDDEDDRLLLSEAFNAVLKKYDYRNKIVFFKDGTLVIDYILKNNLFPFMLISDVNMPKITGFELREQFLTIPHLKQRCVPYIFLTTLTNNSPYSSQAFDLCAHGFFTKPHTYTIYLDMIDKIVSYWKLE